MLAVMVVIASVMSLLQTAMVATICPFGGGLGVYICDGCYGIFHVMIVVSISMVVDVQVAVLVLVLLVVVYFQ